MSDVKLRPCPFCGGRAVLTEDRYAYGGAPFKVECQNCGANRTDYERGEAVGGWNRRPWDGHTCGECANFCADTKRCGSIRECVGEWDTACCDFKKTESEEAK